MSEYSKKYYSDNKDKLLSNQWAYVQRRSIVDPCFKLARTLRTRLCTAIKQNLKSGSAVRDLGRSIQDLKIHLESKFKPGMTWENHGISGWHIDHIQPLVSFDLSNRSELLQACHYTNLQPLWAKENLTKGKSFVEN